MRKWLTGLPLVMWAGIGEGHCRGTFGLEFLMEVVERGLSSDEHRCENMILKLIFLLHYEALNCIKESFVGMIRSFQ